MSCVEAFATGIKVESSNQRTFLGANQGIKVASELLKINGSRIHGCNLTLENQVIKSLRREQSNDQAHFLPIKHFDRGCKGFSRRHKVTTPWNATSQMSLQMFTSPSPSFHLQLTCRNLFFLRKHCPASTQEGNR